MLLLLQVSLGYDLRRHSATVGFDNLGTIRIRAGVSACRPALFNPDDGDPVFDSHAEPAAVVGGLRQRRRA